MKILLTNDDGIHSPGIQALYEALVPHHQVYVVAPEREQSAQSHAFTLHKPLRVQSIGPQQFALSGTPADCSYAAIHGLIPKPDLVISGINRGANLGSDIHYSGTVAAAREAVLQGIPAIAVSLATTSSASKHHWMSAVTVLLRVLPTATKALQPKLFLNINVPNQEKILGIRGAYVGQRRYETAVEKRTDPRGNQYVWLGGPPIHRSIPDDGSDVSLLSRGYATVVPLHTDPTLHTMIETLDGWF